MAEVQSGPETDFQYATMETTADQGTPGVHLRSSQHSVHQPR